MYLLFRVVHITSNMSGTFNPALFDRANSSEFYLPRRARGSAEQPEADVELIVEGQQLAVHSQIVGFKSGLLAMLFKDLAPLPLAAGAGADSEVRAQATACRHATCLASHVKALTYLYTCICPG